MCYDIVMQTKNTFTVYHEFSRQLADSDRADIIRNGWGATTPATPVGGRTGTKVQVIELTVAEFAEWSAAKRRTAETLWRKK